MRKSFRIRAPILNILPDPLARAGSLRSLTLRLGLVVCTVLASQWNAATAHTAALDQFMARPEGAFRWREVGVRTTPNSPVDLEVVSQTWKGREWKHQVRIYRPRKAAFSGSALVLAMGFPTAFDGIIGQMGAETAGVPCVIINGIPNQPLNGQIEDDLLATSLEEMFQHKDPSLSLVFPMAKGIVKTLDALQEWSAKEPGGRTEDFVLIGPSKRGWAAWLAASQDKRIAGLVPLGYNNLRVEKQIPNQMDQWGELSTYLKAYTLRGLTQKIQSPEGAALMAATDPWSFRRRYDMPKLIVDSTNNGYWTLDALNVYRTALPGSTNVLYVANAGHYMEGALPRIVGSIAEWSRLILAGHPHPRIQTRLLPRIGKRGLYSLRATSSRGPSRLWFTFGPSKDFRAATWQSKPVSAAKTGVTSLTVPLPPAPNRKPFGAAFLEYEFPGKPQTLRLTSDVVMWDARIVK